MTPLRQRMIQELELQRKSPKTIQAYVLAVRQLAEHYGQSPDEISQEQVRDFLHYLITKRDLAGSSVNQKLAGIRFFFERVLDRETVRLKVDSKRSKRLPEPLAREEVSRLLEAVHNARACAMAMGSIACVIPLRPTCWNRAST